MPASVIATARENLGEREKQLADHLARVDQDLSRLEQERRQVTRERAQVAETERKLRGREEALREREQALRRRLDAKVEDQVREARKEIDAVIEGLKTRAAQLSEQAAVRLRAGDKLRIAGISTGDTGAVRADARAALDAVVERLKHKTETPPTAPAAPPAPIHEGSRVTIGTLGLEGTVVDVRGKHAEVDVRGKRLRAALRDLRAVVAPAAPAPPGPANVRVNMNLQPREGARSELNVIGCTVDEALSRLEKFLDDATVTDERELRIVHGFGTGQLRRAITAFLDEHPLVARHEPAPQNQGGGGATVVELKD
jgi:DNA mismatch repair protein MutS2